MPYATNPTPPKLLGHTSAAQVAPANRNPIYCLLKIKPQRTFSATWRKLRIGKRRAQKDAQKRTPFWAQEVRARLVCLHLGLPRAQKCGHGNLPFLGPQFGPLGPIFCIGLARFRWVDGQLTTPAHPALPTSSNISWLQVCRSGHKF